MGNDPSLEHPWQKSPTQLILYAEELMNNESDFDHQVAFLLIDVGVETMFMTYLSLPDDVIRSKNKYHERMKFIGKSSFAALVNGVKVTAGQRLKDLDLNRVLYFHNIRNKLYHLGDGIVPTDENLNSYLALAKELLERLLSVDLTPEPVDALVWFFPGIEERTKKDKIKESVENVKESLVDLKLVLAIAVHQTRPEWTKRSFERKLKQIWNEYPDEEAAPLEYRMENQKNRKRLLDELIDVNINEIWFIDKILKDITYLYIAYISDNMERDMNDDIREYKNAHIFLKNRRYEREINLDKYEEIISQSEEIIIWIESYQKEIEEIFWDK